VNKQGSAEPLHPDIANKIRKQIEQQSHASFDEYEDLLHQEVSRETARMVLPLNTYTEVVWKMDVSNLIKLLRLRDDPHSQWEIREYAKMLSATLAEYFPLTFKVYEEMKNSVILTIPQLLAVVTNNSAGGPLGKGEQAKVDKILDMLMRMLEKP
jgi:thymidylate synthase (FAD)